LQDEPLEGQIYNVSTLRDGRIVRIDDYRRRGEALAAAGVAEDAAGGEDETALTASLEGEELRCSGRDATVRRQGQGRNCHRGGWSRFEPD
jgi:hypothetical protein